MFTKGKNPGDPLDKDFLLAILAAAIGVGVASVTTVFVFREIQKKKRRKNLARLGQLPSREHIRMAGDGGWGS